MDPQPKYLQEYSHKINKKKLLRAHITTIQLEKREINVCLLPCKRINKSTGGYI